MIFAFEFWESKKASNSSATTRNSLWSMDSKNSNVPFKVLFLCLLRKSAGLCLFWSFFWGVLGLGSLSAQFWSTPAVTRAVCKTTTKIAFAQHELHELAFNSSKVKKIVIKTFVSWPLWLSFIILTDGTIGITEPPRKI